MSNERLTKRIEYLTKENLEFKKQIDKLKRRYNLNLDNIKNLKRKRGDYDMFIPDYYD